MSEYRTWLRYMVLCSMTVGLVGFANAGQANGKSHVALVMTQRGDHDRDKQDRDHDRGWHGQGHDQGRHGEGHDRGWHGQNPKRQGHGQDHEGDWRRVHPQWDGHYYWHNNTYYYDRGYSHPAIVDHEWATIGGGVILSNDPYVYFSGSFGTLYPTASLQIDLVSGDRNRHVRALYFQHPYFWRNGIRYDRVIVTQDGRHYYRFVRHRF